MSRIEAIRAKLGQLPDIRAKVDRLQIERAEAIAYYTDLNAEMRSLIQLVSELSASHGISISTLGMINFLQGKERAGIELPELLHLQSLIPAQDLAMRTEKTGRSFLRPTFTQRVGTGTSPR